MRLAGPLLAMAMMAAPVCPACNATELAVVSQGAGTIALIDPERGVVTRDVTVGTGPAAASAGDGALFITYPEGRKIGILDVVGRTGLRVLPFDGQGFGILADEHVLYVTDWAGGRVLKLDASDGRVLASAGVGRDPAGLALDRKAGRLYVADRGTNEVSVVDAVDLRRMATIPVGRAPYALALSPEGGRLYVADVRDDDVSVIDTRRLTRIATVAVGAMPYGVTVTPDGSRVLVSNQHSGTLSVLDATTNVAVATIPVGRYPEGVICVAGHALVANWFSDDVSVVDLTARREVRRIKVGDGPRGFAGPIGAD